MGKNVKNLKEVWILFSSPFKSQVYFLGGTEHSWGFANTPPFLPLWKPREIQAEGSSGECNTSARLSSSHTALLFVSNSRGDEKWRRASVISQVDETAASVVFAAHVCLHMRAYSDLWSVQERQCANKQSLWCIPRLEVQEDDESATCRVAERKKTVLRSQDWTPAATSITLCVFSNNVTFLFRQQWSKSMDTLLWHFFLSFLFRFPPPLLPFAQAVPWQSMFRRLISKSVCLLSTSLCKL